ncbi:hypothetical protein WDU94_005523 [Cyamophila willieti]
MPNVESVRIHDQRNCAESCDCESIEIVTHWKYLGIEIDSHLRWDKHINSLIKRVRRYIYPFLSLRQFLNIPLLKQMYFALVQSVLEYGLCVYGRADPTVKQKLKSVQNLILKIIYRKNNLFSTERLYRELQVLDLENLFKKNICAYVHKNRTELLATMEHGYNTRRQNIIIPKFSTAKGQKSIQYIGIKMYEKIPDIFKLENDCKKFKSNLKDWLIKTQ